MKRLLVQVVEKASVSAVTVLLTCWPATVLCGNSTTSNNTSVGQWINMPIPLFYAIGLGGLLLVTVIGCIICLWCTRRRKGKEYITHETKESPLEDGTWEMIDNPVKEAGSDEKNASQPDVEKPDGITIKISVQSVNKKDEGNSDETAEQGEAVLDEEHKQQAIRPEDEVTDEEPGTESGMVCTECTGENIDKQENSADEVKEGKNKEVHGPLFENRPKQRHGEPVYAEVNKPKKTKKKEQSGYNIVYAELADFDKNRSEGSLPKGNHSSADYAEIARLTKSPRDMCPLDD